MPLTRNKRKVSEVLEHSSQRTSEVTTEEPGPEAIRAAVQQFADFLRQNARTLTLRAFRRKLEIHLGCKEGTLDAPQAKDLVAELATRKLDAEVFDFQAHSLNAPTAAPCPISVLPQGLLAHIFCHLEQGDLAYAPQVCRAWRDAFQDAGVWRHHLRCVLGLPMWDYWQRHNWLKHLYPTSTARTSDVRDKYKMACYLLASRVCYDCKDYNKEAGAPLQRQTLALAALRFSLCIDCSEGYAERRDGQRLLTKSTAMYLYKLRSKDLEGICYALDVNPINPSFNAMMLYRRRDVVRAAIRRWGGVASMESHRVKEAHV